MRSLDPTASDGGNELAIFMDETCIDEEREALNRRRREITSQLQSLAGHDGNLDAATLEMRREPLLKQISEIERRLAELDLDERSLRCMEGGE
jgi:hypothetical protein